MHTSLISACLLLFGTALAPARHAGLSPAEVCVFLPRTPLPGPAPQEPQAPAADDAKPAAEAKASDPKALEHLDKAIARQGGKELAAGVTKLHLLFAKAVGHKAGDHPDADAQGSFEVDRGGLEIDWMAPRNFRSKIVIDGKTKVRGQFEKYGQATAWLDDGKTSTQLTGEKYEKDRRQIADQLDLVQALLDVAVLSRMKGDGSVWSVDPRTADAKDGIVRLQRIPPQVAEGQPKKLHLLVEFDTKTYDPTRMVVLPRAAGDPVLRVTFGYNDSYPKTKGGGDVRFPFKVDVDEKTTVDGPFEKVLELAVHNVAFNAATALDDASFKQPKRGK